MDAVESPMKRMRRQIRVWLKKIILNNPIRRSHIAQKQSGYLDKLSAGTNPRMILFMVPNLNKVNGGIMSIILLASESEKIKHQHQADVFVAPMPGGNPFLKFTKFPNNRILVDLKMLMSRYGENSDILVHLPEGYIVPFMAWLKEYSTQFSRLRFNVMLQNFDVRPSREVIDRLATIGPVTITTAHLAYSGSDTEKMYGCPVHHLSAWVSDVEYERRPFAQRENIFLLSSDKHEHRESIVKALKKSLPQFRFVVVKRMTYSAYRELISKSKFSLTFGEGFDGYFSEIIWSGGIGSTVYNDSYFKENWSNAPFVYSSWEELLERLPGDVESANVEVKYEGVNGVLFNLLSREYSYKEYQENIAAFYSKYYPM